MKPGRDAIDPTGRTVRVVDVERDPSGDPRRDMMIVKLRGPYAATVKYPRSVLKEIDERAEG